MASSDTPKGAATPWGEPYPDLANAVLGDRSAPPVLALAAVKARLGDDSQLRRLVADAVALNEQEARRG